MERKDELEAQVRKTSLRERLDECRTRIGKMCSEGRPPRMCIPVQWDDDDFYISTTLADAQRALDAEREKAKQLDRTLADVYQQRDGLQAQLRQVEGAYQKLLNVIDDSHDEDLPIEIIEARDEAYKFLVAQDAKPRKCPTCDSPSPHLHPAVQHEGEVQVCSNRWHKVAQDAGKAVSSG